MGKTQKRSCLELLLKFPASVTSHQSPRAPWINHGTPGHHQFLSAVHNAKSKNSKQHVQPLYNCCCVTHIRSRPSTQIAAAAPSCVPVAIVGIGVRLRRQRGGRRRAVGGRSTSCETQRRQQGFGGLAVVRAEEEEQWMPRLARRRSLRRRQQP